MLGLLLFYVLRIGISLPKMLNNIFPGENTITVLNGLLIFYWMFELLFRLIFQRNVTLNIQYYLTLRIKSNNLANFMLLKSWVSLFLLITILLFAPFAFGKITSTYSLAAGWLWFGFVFAVSFLLHHFVVALHQLTRGKILLPLVLGSTILLAAHLNFIGYVNFTYLTNGLLVLIREQPLLILIPVLLSATLFLIDIGLVRGNLHLDHTPQKISLAVGGVSRWVAYLSAQGTVGQLIALELRLIWRNKRPRTMMLSGLLLIPYFFYFIPKLGDSTMSEVFLLLGTGLMMINYGQLLFSWESSYFDFLMTRNYSPRKYLMSKFVLLLGFNTFSLILLGIIISFIEISLLKGLIIFYLVNSGVFIYIFLWGTMLGPKKIDVGAGAMFNYEGMNAFQFLIMIPYILLPLGAMYLLESGIGENWGDIILISIGFSGVLFYGAILRYLAKGFTKRKYKILNGFRE